MFGNPIQTIVGGIAAISVSFLAGIWYGDSYGSSAHKLASAQSQLNAINTALAIQVEEDALSWAVETGAERQRTKDFAKTSPTLKKCILDNDQVEALNKLTDGG